MVKEYEGKTEEEAIAKAMADLGLHESEFDLEVVDTGKKGLFKKGTVKIKVYVNEGSEENSKDDGFAEEYKPNPELERKVISFSETIIKKMGFFAKVSLTSREKNKIFLDILSEDANLIIGKHGKNLDALQILTNVYASKLLGSEQKILKIVIDAENYRSRREEHLVRLAIKSAQQVRRTRASLLLEPMNPFERRIIHTSLSDMKDIKTESEGDGLIKQVRIFYIEN